MSDCTCLVKPPLHTASYGQSLSKYAVYIDTVEDNTQFDPECSYHGDNGTMVARVVIRSDLTSANEAV